MATVHVKNSTTRKLLSEIGDKCSRSGTPVRDVKPFSKKKKYKPGKLSQEMIDKGISMQPMLPPTGKIFKLKIVKYDTPVYPLATNQ